MPDSVDSPAPLSTTTSPSPSSSRRGARSGTVGADVLELTAPSCLARLPAAGPPTRQESLMTNRLYGPLENPAQEAGWDGAPPRKGFFTDTSVCIGCKACEVACKEWNDVPEDGLNLLGSSFDNTGALGASTWRHVAFIEQPGQLGEQHSPITAAPTGPSAGTQIRVADETMPDRSRLGTEP